MSDLPERLREACKGHPVAKINWPHRLLHDAADEIERLRAENHRLRTVLEMVDAWDFDWDVEGIKVMVRAALRAESD